MIGLRIRRARRLTDNTGDTDRAIRLGTSDEIFNTCGIKELDVREGQDL